MTPRPPYRWKSFWIGLFLLGFLSWAWRDGLRMDTRLAYAGPVTAWKVGRIDGSTILVAGRADLLTDKPGWNFHREQRRWNLSSWTHFWDATGKTDIRYLAIPDMLIFFPCITAWLTWIGWRMWRSSQLEMKYLQRR